MGLECGEIVFTVALLSIIITASLETFLIGFTYKKLLKGIGFNLNGCFFVIPVIYYM